MPCQSSGSSATGQFPLKKSTLYLSTLKVEWPTLTNVFQDFLWEKGLWKCHSFKTPSTKSWNKNKTSIFWSVYRAKDLCYLFNLYRGSEHNKPAKTKIHAPAPAVTLGPPRQTNPFTTPAAIQISYSILLQTQQSFFINFYLKPYKLWTEMYDRGRFRDKERQQSYESVKGWNFKQYEGIISDCSWKVSPSSVSCERNSLVWAEQKPVPLTLAGHGTRLENG